MDISQLDYPLPPRLIAQQAFADRDQCRLMVLERGRTALEHRRFENILDYLHPGDCLVLNDSQVIPARFFAQRTTGALIEGLFLRLNERREWLVLLKNASRLKIGEIITFCLPGESTLPVGRPGLRVLAKEEKGLWRLRPEPDTNYLDLLRRFGCTPLPPYIHRSRCEQNNPLDQQLYQTVYAARPGSVAAPTAGLHFTPDLLNRIRERGVRIAFLTLHVGLGTFKPITAPRLEEHVMHSEAYSLDENNAAVINDAAQSGGRIVAAGTTVVRTLESIARGRGVVPGCGETNIFITPGHRFQIVDALITNFHLPRSTLLALVCAFAGTEAVLAAYRSAVDLEYRFYSYGDAMLIL